MSVDVWHEDGDQVAQKVHMHLVAESNETHPVAVYKYAHWAQLGDKLVFAPRHGEQDSDAELSDGKKILFYPRDQKVIDLRKPKVKHILDAIVISCRGEI